MSQKFCLLISCATKEHFLREYEKSCLGKSDAKELYMLLLIELKTSILKGNIDNFKNLINLVSYIGDVEDQETLKEYYSSMDNPIKNTNVILLACKHNKLQILRYVLTNINIFNNLSINVNMESITPYCVDEANHNSFYYAIGSGNVELLDALISNWPDDYFANHLMELDEILSTAYEELKLKNVLLSKKTEVFVESKLISLRFFSNPTSEHVTTLKYDQHNIRHRVRLVIKNIGILKTEYFNSRDIDERFLYITKFVAQNMYVLKRQLKSTYDRLPWEEMEFCLVSFVSSQIRQQEMNLFNHATLNKEKIITYLEYFAKKLGKVFEIVDVNALSNLPKLKREEVILKIISNNPEFVSLYNDYQQVRDIHSLERINSYVKLALTADPKIKEGQLVITRALQVIGEYLKNSLESPKMSNDTSERLIVSLPKNTRKIIIELRNSLSHAFSLNKRTEIEGNNITFFMGVQNDTKEIGDVIANILYVRKIKMIRTLLNKILESKNLDEMREAVEILNKTDLEAVLKIDFIMIEQKNFQKLVEEFCSNVPVKTSYEQKQFDKINQILMNIEKNIENAETDYIVGFAELKGIHYRLNDNNKTNNYSINGIKFRAAAALNYISSKIEPQKLKDVATFSKNIFVNAKLRITQDKLDDVCRILWEMFCISEYKMDEIKFIQELKESLNDNKSLIPAFKSSITKKEYDDELKLRLSQLKSFLSCMNLFDNQFIENFHAYENNIKLQAVVEMLVLDIMSILGSSKNYLENNLLILDSHSPLLTGKCLRNHLAHYNDLIDLFLSDPAIAILLNAKKLTTENIIKSNKKIGMLIRDDPLKLEDEFSQNLVCITNQKNMFVAIEEGNLQILKKWLNEGADINARNINLWSSMHFAAKGGNLEIVEFILEQSSNINVKDINGQNPLHIAATYGRNNIVEFFLKNTDLLIDDVDCYGKTPLHIAAQNGQKDTVAVLLQNKANVFIHDVLGLLPLYYAIRNAHINVVDILLGKDVDIDVYEAKGGFTPLHEAAENGSTELVIFLLKRGANVNAKNDRFWTPLHAAARNGYPEVVNALILNGADINAKVLNNNNSLHYAVETNQEIVVNILLKHGIEVNVFRSKDLMSPLHIAAMNGHKNIVENLLKYGANIQIPNIYGMTALHFAAEYGFIEIVTDLLKYDIDVNAKTKNNYTPLHFAAKCGYKEIVDVLLKNQAIINIKTIEGFIPLHMAASKGHQDIIDILIKKNNGINARTIEGATPLHLAVMNINMNVVNLLINCKADINAKTNNGCTPLNIASKNGMEDNVDLLIKNNADVNSKDAAGITALHRAAREGHKGIVDILLKFKADVNAKDIADCTPLHIAIEAGFKDVVKILIENGANVNAKVENNITPLFLAVKHNYVDIVKILIANGTDMNVDCKEAILFAVQVGFKDIVECFLKNRFNINTKYDESCTLLHIAASKGHVELVNALILKGADVNATNIYKETPLYFAARAGYMDIVKILMERGSSISAVNDEGFTPLHIAAIKGQNNVVKFLLDNKVKVNVKDNINRTPLEFAISYSHYEIIKMLLQYKEININSKGNDNFILLHIAAEKNNLEIVEYLVEKGSNINARNTSGTKPIHIAAREGHIDIVKFLLSKGNKVNELGNCNQTLLHYAVIKDQTEMVKYLITQGVNVNPRDSNCVTPMHIAATLGHKNVIKVLLQHGGVFNIVNECLINNMDVRNILTSTEKLFTAVKGNNISLVELCIKMGAFVNTKDDMNDTPLHYAAMNGNMNIVNILLQSKSNPNEVDKRGLTSLHYAAKFSHLQIVKVLLFNGAIYNAVCNSGKTPLDIATDKNIISLLKLVNESFTGIGENSNVVKNLNKIKDIEIVKAVLNAHNRENRSLIVAAMHNNFKNIDQLKEILQGDVSNKVYRALILLNQDNYQESLSIFKNVLVKRKEIFRLDDPAILDIQIHIAKVLYKQGNYQKALNMLKKASNVLKNTLGLHNKDTLCTRSMIALILHKQGNNEEALNIFQEVLPKQKQILGSDHTDTLDTQLYMALVLNDLKRYEEALNLNEEVFKKRKESNHPNTLLAQNNIAMVLFNQGKVELSLKVFNEVLEKKKILYGPNNCDTLRALQNIATILFNQKQYHKALVKYQELLELHKRFLGTNHPDTLTTLYALATVFYAQGKWNSAYKYFTEGLEQRKTIWGSNHPSVVDILNKIKDINFILQVQEGKKPDTLEDLQNKDNQKAIFDAASIGNIDTVQNLLKNGVDVNTADAFGRTPLHYASYNGHINVVNVLLENGAEKLLATNKGNTPLHTAVSKGHKAIVEVLLQGNSCIEFINSKTTIGGTTALHIATKNSFFDIVLSLLKHGGYYNIQNQDGLAPINLAKDKSIINVLKLLEELFDDAKNGNIYIINKFKDVTSDEFAAMTNARNKTGETLVQVAIVNKHTVIAKKILNVMKNKIKMF